MRDLGRCYTECLRNTVVRESPKLIPQKVDIPPELAIMDTVLNAVTTTLAIANNQARA